MKIKTKGAFITKTNRVISKGAGETIDIPEADYNEVKDLCILLDSVPTKLTKRSGLSTKKPDLTTRKEGETK